MKKFLMLILFPLMVSANDLQMLHETFVESATTEHQKKVIAAYLERVEAIKQERIANLNESKRVARGGKALYARVFESEMNRRIESLK